MLHYRQLGAVPVLQWRSSGGASIVAQRQPLGTATTTLFQQSQEKLHRRTALWNRRTPSRRLHSPSTASTYLSDRRIHAAMESTTGAVAERQEKEREKDCISGAAVPRRRRAALLPTRRWSPALLASSGTATATAAVSANQSISFELDPPFTAVDGEEKIRSEKQLEYPVLYHCRRCSAGLFSSGNYGKMSSIGRHCSGWPTFTAPLSPDTLQLVGCLQKTCVAQIHASPSSLSSGIERLKSSLKPSSSLVCPTPAVAAAHRSLAVEGDSIHASGRPVSRGKCPTWRESCIRDGNQRVDAAMIIGCCASCRAPVCRVTNSSPDGLLYITTASSVVATATPDGRLK